MKISAALFLAVTLSLSGLACDPEYPLRFICEPGGDGCPHRSECPEVPLGPDSCGDLPGLFGHAAIPMTAGRPVGCQALLPYGNPAYGNTQQSCVCNTSIGPAATWWCPV